jgi:DNA-binding response OmpR family regulator
VVEPDEAIREGLRWALSEEDYTVLDCDDAATAFEHVRIFGPQVILMDVLGPSSHEAMFLAQYRLLPGSRPPILGLTTALKLTGQAARLGLADLLARVQQLAAGQPEPGEPPSNPTWPEG